MPTPIRGRDTITAADALQRIRAASPRDVRPADTADYVRELVALCVAFGLRHTVLLSQWHHETGGGGPEGRWRELNAAGLGITSSIDPTPYKILDGTEAAALHVWSMLVALREWNSAGRIILPPAAIGWVRRWSAKYNDPACPLVTNVEDLNRVYSGDRATWAVDAKYDTKLLAVMERLFPATGESENAVSVIPVPAPPVEIAITPPGANRPALEMPSPSWITVHEVGNQSPGADENMHRNFVHNGGGPSQVSFHFVVGPTKAIQLIPLDEAAWHASDGYTGTGNRDSVAIETIQIGDFDKTLWNLAWLINEIATNPDRFFHNKPRSWDMSIQQIAQHNHWAPDGKNCPEFIRNRGLWPTLMERVDLWHTNSVPGDTTTPPPPKYAKPNVPDWLIDDTLLKVEMIDKTPTYPVSMVFTATKDTPRRQGGDPNLAEVGPVLKKGQRFRSTRVFRSRNKTWVLTKNGSRIAGDDLSPRVIVSVDGHVSVQF